MIIFELRVLLTSPAFATLRKADLELVTKMQILDSPESISSAPNAKTSMTEESMKKQLSSEKSTIAVSLSREPLHEGLYIVVSTKHGGPTVTEDLPTQDMKEELGLSSREETNESDFSYGRSEMIPVFACLQEEPRRLFF